MKLEIDLTEEETNELLFFVEEQLEFDLNYVHDLDVPEPFKRAIIKLLHSVGRVSDD